MQLIPVSGPCYGTRGTPWQPVFMFKRCRSVTRIAGLSWFSSFFATSFPTESASALLQNTLLPAKAGMVC